MLSQGRWSLRGKCLSPCVGDAFFAFICIISLGTSLTFSLFAQRRIWWRTGGGLCWSVFIQLEARVSLDSSVTQAAARRSCSKGAGRMTLAAIAFWCSPEKSFCAVEMARKETQPHLKWRLPGLNAMGNARAAGVPRARALVWGCWRLELANPGFGPEAAAPVAWKVCPISMQVCETLLMRSPPSLWIKSAGRPWEKLPWPSAPTQALYHCLCLLLVSSSGCRG